MDCISNNRTDYIAELAAELIELEILAVKLDNLAEDYYFREQTEMLDELLAVSAEYEEKSNLIMLYIKQAELGAVRVRKNALYAVTS